jgi:hypothetical protein
MAWMAAGRPRGPQTLGSFESWAAIIGGVLDVAGVRGFLENQHAAYDEADAEAQVWGGIL